MTTQTIAAGIGLILISLGVLIIAIVRSAGAERRNNRTTTIVRVSQAAVVTPKDATGIDDLWLELLATPRHIPAPRGPGAWS